MNKSMIDSAAPEKRLVYVASCSHSGSTLLDMLLSTHPRIVGLGETAMLLKPAKRSRYEAAPERYLCSCRQRLDQCELWSRVLPRFASARGLGTRDAYRILLQEFQAAFGDDTVLSDSSKYVGYLRELLRADNAGALFLPQDVLVMHLYKDARAYVSSMRRRFKIGPHDEATIRSHFEDWREQNAAIEVATRKLRAECIPISYEGICFETEAVMAVVCARLGLTADAPSLGKLDQSVGHVGLGNPMRTHEAKSKAVHYDAEWFHDVPTHKVYASLPEVQEYNQHLFDRCMTRKLAPSHRRRNRKSAERSQKAVKTAHES